MRVHRLGVAVRRSAWGARRNAWTSSEFAVGKGLVLRRDAPSVLEEELRDEVMVLSKRGSWGDEEEAEEVVRLLLLLLCLELKEHSYSVQAMAMLRMMLQYKKWFVVIYEDKTPVFFASDDERKAPSLYACATKTAANKMINAFPAEALTIVALTGMRVYELFQEYQELESLIFLSAFQERSPVIDRAKQKSMDALRVCAAGASAVLALEEEGEEASKETLLRLITNKDALFFLLQAVDGKTREPMVLPPDQPQLVFTCFDQIALLPSKDFDSGVLHPVARVLDRKLLFELNQQFDLRILTTASEDSNGFHGYSFARGEFQSLVHEKN